MKSEQNENNSTKHSGGGNGAGSGVNNWVFQPIFLFFFNFRATISLIRRQFSFGHSFLFFAFLFNVTLLDHLDEKW